MKQSLKKVLPIPALNAIRAVQSRINLVQAGKANFSEDNLMSAYNVNVQKILSRSDLEASWNDTHAQILTLFGHENKMDGVNPGDRRALFYLIMALAPSRVLEVGTHIGASTLHIAMALKLLGEERHITTVDIADVNDAASAPWVRAGLSSSPADFARKLGCDNLITFYAQPSIDFMRNAKQGYDLIFLDGDHSAKAVYQEMSHALRLLNPGGVIVLHDYYPHGRALFPDGHIISGPYMALERIKSANPAINVLPLGETPWPTKQGVHATSLAVVLKQ